MVETVQNQDLYLDPNTGLRVYSAEQFNLLQQELVDLTLETESLIGGPQKHIPRLYGHVLQIKSKYRQHNYDHPYCDSAGALMQSSIDLDKFRLPINSNIFTISYDSNDQPEAIHNNGQAPIEIKTSGVLSGLVCVDNTPYLTSQLIIGCVGDPGSYDVTNPEFIFVTDCLSNDSFLEISQIVGSTAVILIREIPQLERLENKHVDNLQQKLI